MAHVDIMTLPVRLAVTLTALSCSASVAPELDFASDVSYLEWQLKTAFNVSLNPYSFSVQALFRTRTDDGVIFSAASFSRLEHIKVDVSSQSTRRSINECSW